jgi:hypothetical protein
MTSQETLLTLTQVWKKIQRRGTSLVEKAKVFIRPSVMGFDEPASERDARL